MLPGGKPPGSIDMSPLLEDLGLEEALPAQDLFDRTHVARRLPLHQDICMSAVVVLDWRYCRAATNAPCVAVLLLDSCVRHI